MPRSDGRVIDDTTSTRFVGAIDLSAIHPVRSAGLVGTAFSIGRLESEASKDISQVPWPMSIQYPYFHATIRCIRSFWFQAQQRAQIYHASNTQTNDDTSASAICLHHRCHQITPRLLQVGVTSDRLDLEGDIVMFQQPGEDAAGAERIGLEGDENKDWR